MTIYEKLSSPARLYIKKCPHCNLMYLGRTIKENIEEYSGSGKKWKFHIKKHKQDKRASERDVRNYKNIIRKTIRYGHGNKTSRFKHKRINRNNISISKGSEIAKWQQRYIKFK